MTITAWLSDCGEWIAIDFENFSMGHGNTKEAAIRDVENRVKEKESENET